MRSIPTSSAAPAGVLLAAAALALPVSSAAQSAAAESAEEASPGAEAAATITAEDLRRRIGALAHDSMRGRDTPSPELRETARFVAGLFEAAGLEPGLGGDGYQQWFPVTIARPAPDSAQRVVLRGPDGETRLVPGRDFVAAPTAPAASATGPLRTPGAERDRLRVGVLIASSGPDGLGAVFGRLREELQGGDVGGAILALRAPDPVFGNLRRFFSQERISLGEPGRLEKPVILARASALPAGLSAALEEGSVLEGWSAELGTRAEITSDRAMNTIGWIPGSDPELKDEYVVFTAHMDHVGVGRPVEGDSIYNGADDDGSGTATVIELAEAFAGLDPSPRRSVVFMTVSGEEKGLLGSQWYVEHPVFPLSRTVAAINIDMIGRNWRDTVVAIGKRHSSLGALVDRVADERPELGLTVVEDRWPEEHFYYRSDHYNFARNGVPVLFFFSGTHEDYHRPSDEAAKIDYEKTARIARLIFGLGLEVANADEPPRWDEEAYRRVVGGASEQ